MIPVSNDYRRQLIAGNRNWVVKIDMTLANGTSLELTNDQIWEGGITIDEAISSDTSFDIGSAIIGSLQIVIDNITGNFSQYDFFGASLVLWLGVEGDIDSSDIQRYYRKGFYVVDKPSYNGSLITLECLDNMTWFDVPFSGVTGITYPATAGTVVQAICSKVGVTLGTPTFPNYSNTHTRILAKPDQELNCREVLQYIAQMCCCYCKINTAGQLVLKWHDKSAIIGIQDYDGGTFSTTTTPYSDGDAVDGMLFNPWNQGTQFDGGTFEQLRDRVFISQNFQIEVSTDDVVVTGCRVRNNTTTDTDKAYDELWVDSTLEQTHPRYVLIIDNNPLITKAKAANIASIVGNTLAGLPIRGFTSSSLADFSYETGDMATVIDFRGNRYYTWLTSFTFALNITESFACGVESLRKRSEQRFSGTVKTLAEANQNAEDILSAYDTAVKAMDSLAQASVGYNEYVYPDNAGVGTSRTMWRYNGSQRTGTASNPKFPNSSVVFKIAGDGVFISRDGGNTYDNGYDANSGTAILNTLYAQGISCDSIRSGRLSLGGSTSGQYKNGELYMYGSNDVEVGHWTSGGISVKTGTVTLGGKTSLTDANSGVYIGSDGISLGPSSTFKVANTGRVDCTNLNVTGGEINGPTIKSYYNSTENTTISGGSVVIRAGDDNFLNIIGTNGQNVTFGPHISVNGSWVEHDLTYLGWAVEDAYNAHSSDKALKKKIKDIPVKKSRDLILGARPRYYEFKKGLEGGVRSGFVAQELRESLDNIGDTTAIERESARREGEREVIYEDFIAHLVNTTQDLYKQVNDLKAELAELKAKVK